jgi:hypothetical protein
VFSSRVVLRIALSIDPDQRPSKRSDARRQGKRRTKPGQLLTRDGRWDCRSMRHIWSSDELNVPDLRTREGAERELAWLQTWQPCEGDWTYGGVIEAKEGK